jgi:hypothetical protein
MALVLSQQQKNILDRILWVVGAVGGYVTANAAGLPGVDPVLAGTVGLALSDVASDLIGFVDTGAVPSAATVQQQATAILSQAQKIQGLTPVETQALATALAVLQAHPS